MPASKSSLYCPGIGLREGGGGREWGERGGEGEGEKEREERQSGGFEKKC